MKKRPTRTGPTLRQWILGLGLVLWLVSMVILTCCVASDMVIQLEKELYTYVQSEGSRSHHGDTDLSGTAEFNMIDNLGNIYYRVDIDPLLPIVGEQLLTNGLSSKEWLWGKWELYYGYEAAVIYYDGEGQELIRTGDYLAFDYTSPESWTSQELISLGKSYVALDRIPGGPERFNNMIYDYPPGDFGLDLLLPLLRLTGWFEGNEFHPALIESGDYLDYSGWISDADKLAELDARGKVEWETMLTAETPVGQDLVTIYAWNLEGYNVKPKSVSVQGREYNSLADLLHAKFNAEDRHTPFKRNLFDTVMVDFGYHEDVFGEYRIAAAVRCHPLFYAVVRLIWVYVISLGILSLLLWRMVRRIRLEVSEPMERMVGAIRQGYIITPQSDWAEPSAIEEDFVKTRQTLAENKSEINQLHTALDYARDAEEKRKTLISNITHELKTPLAIIHSYTECLQEDVAPEKREQYLATILDETPVPYNGIRAQIVELGGIPAPSAELSECHVEGSETSMGEAIDQAAAEGDSLGAVIECVVPEIDPGYGEPFWNSVESQIAHAIFSIPGVRGVEFGDGFKAAAMRGSEHNDPIGEDGRPAKNGAGGVNGGLTNGAPLKFRVAFKPTSSIAKPQQAFNFATGEMDTLQIKGRHDVCFALRCPVIVEAMTAIVLADFALLR